MHIILGMLGSIVTILWLLHRLAEMGIDLGGLNPWLWQRRRKFRQKFEANPIFAIESPMEATALLVTAAAKADGDMSANEKSHILAMFEQEFGQSKRDAAGLLISSTHLLGRGDEVREDLSTVLARSIGNFSAGQAESAVALVERIIALDGGPSDMQRQLAQDVESVLKEVHAPKAKWD